MLLKPEKVRQVISKLMILEKDCSLPITLDNIIHATDVLCGHISVLFTAMLQHGVSIYGMLIGTMVTITQRKG